MASIVSAGTTSATALNMSADTTGVLQLASNNGTVGLTMDTSQNVGIGTTSPATFGKFAVLNNGTSGLVVSDGSTTDFRVDTASSVTTLRNTAVASLAFNTNGAERMRIDSSGNVGIGTSSPSTYVSNGGLAIFGLFGTSSKAMTIYNNSGASASNVARIDFKLNNTFANGSTSAAIYGMNPNAAGNNGGALVFAVSSDGTNTDPSERARINSVGDLLVGTSTSAAARLRVEYTGQIQGIRIGTTATSSNAVQFVYEPATQVGTITMSTTNTFYNTSSDYRMKNSVAPMTGALGKIALLKPCTYKWNIDGSDGQGFIAHELQEVYPDAVTGEKDGEQMQGVDYGKLTPILTAALQEAIAKIETLEARIAVLEKK